MTDPTPKCTQNFVSQAGVEFDSLNKDHKQWKLRNGSVVTFCTSRGKNKIAHPGQKNKIAHNCFVFRYKVPKYSQTVETLDEKKTGFEKQDRWEEWSTGKLTTTKCTTGGGGGCKIECSKSIPCTPGRCFCSSRSARDTDWLLLLHWTRATIIIEQLFYYYGGT